MCLIYNFINYIEKIKQNKLKKDLLNFDLHKCELACFDEKYLKYIIFECTDEKEINKAADSFFSKEYEAKTKTFKASGQFEFYYSVYELMDAINELQDPSKPGLFIIYTLKYLEAYINFKRLRFDMDFYNQESVFMTKYFNKKPENEENKELSTKIKEETNIIVRNKDNEVSHDLNNNKVKKIRCSICKNKVSPKFIYKGEINQDSFTGIDFSNLQGISCKSCKNISSITHQKADRPSKYNQKRKNDWNRTNYYYFKNTKY